MLLGSDVSFDDWNDVNISRCAHVSEISFPFGVEVSWSRIGVGINLFEEAEMCDILARALDEQHISATACV